MLLELIGARDSIATFGIASTRSVRSPTVREGYVALANARASDTAC